MGPTTETATLKRARHSKCVDWRRPQNKTSKKSPFCFKQKAFFLLFSIWHFKKLSLLNSRLEVFNSRTMCKLKLKEIIPSFFSSEVQLLSKNSSQSHLHSKPSYLSRSKSTRCQPNIPVFQRTAHGAAASPLTRILLVCVHACPVKLIGEIQLPDSNIKEGFFAV